MSNNAPDYHDNLAFDTTGDWSDRGLRATTDRTQSSLDLVNKIEKLTKQNQKLEEHIHNLKILLSTCRDIITHSYPEAEFTNLLTKIKNELLHY